MDFSVENLEKVDGYELMVDVSVNFKTHDHGISKILVKPRDAHAVEPVFIYPSENGEFSDTLKIVARDRQAELGVILTPWFQEIEDQETSVHETHVKLLSAQKIALCDDVTGKKPEKRVLERITEFYSEDAPYSLLAFTTESRRILKYEPFVKLMSDIAAMDSRYGGQIGSTRAQFFKNMIIGDSGGGYHRITGYEEFQKKLEIFRQQPSLRSVDEEYAIKLALRDLEDNERFDDLYTTIRQLNIAEKRSHILYEYQLEFYIAKSKTDGRNLPMAAVTELSNNVEIEDYSDALKEAKLGGDSFEETAALWRDLIGPAIEYSHKHLQFVLGRYIHWKTRFYTQNNHQLELAPLLNRGALELSKSADDQKYAQLSKYNLHLRKGFRYLSENRMEGAQKEFGEALLVASNENSEWYERRPDLIPLLIRYKTLAEVGGGPVEYEYDNKESLSVDLQEADSEELETKLSLINERIELLKATFRDTDISVEYEVNSLRAARFRLLANERIRSQHYELAVESANEVISIYAQLGDDSKRQYAIGLRQHLSAVLAETQARFDEAATHYANASENLEYSSSERQRFHEIRSKTCRAKSSLLDGDLYQANEILEEITDSVSEIKYEVNDLSLLIELLFDFENSMKTPMDIIFDRLSEEESDSGRNLSISFDYKPAATSVLSAQRLKQRGVDEELLRRFIKIGIAESFTPASSEEIVSDTGLSDVSLDLEWRNYLPSYTHRNFERIEIKENSVATGDWSDVASKLFSTFEKYLEVLVEYYGSQSGVAWREKITDDPEKDLALGNLVQFFQTGELSDILPDSGSVVKEEVDNSILRGMQLVKVRNELDHGHIDTLSQEEYKSLKSSIVRIFEETALDAPIIFQPKTKNTFGSTTVYSCELFWSHPQKQASIETQADMNVSEVFFMSPECRPLLGEREIVEIGSDNIVRSVERRAVEAVTNTA